MAKVVNNWLTHAIEQQIMCCGIVMATMIIIPQEPLHYFYSAASTVLQLKWNG